MHLAQWDVGGLVFGQKQHLAAIGDFGRAFDDDPVLCTVVVLLQTEAGAGLDLDALDLKAAAFVDAVVPAPGAVHLAVQGVFFAFAGLQLSNDVLDVLAAGFDGYEHGIRCFDHDEVFYTNQTDQAARGMHQGVAAVGGQHIAHMGVAVFVFWQYVPHSIPGAEVAPAGVQRDHVNGEGTARAAFHDGVVYGFAGDSGEFCLAWAYEGRGGVGVGVACFPGGLGGLQYVGPELLQGF